MQSTETLLEALPAPWYWQNGVLLSSGRYRPVVIAPSAGGAILARNAFGILKAITEEHPVAVALTALPDLLAACLAVVDNLDHPQQMRAAIAKAIGEEKEVCHA